jgi:HPt (histidine-containing phosphotransfer) domain-containing protein
LTGLLLEAGAAIARNDFAVAKGIGHKIKGAGGSFGFDRISDLGGEFETAASYEDQDSTFRTLADLKACAEEIKKNEG